MKLISGWMDTRTSKKVVFSCKEQPVVSLDDQYFYSWHNLSLHQGYEFIHTPTIITMGGWKIIRFFSKSKPKSGLQNVSLQTGNIWVLKLAAALIINLETDVCTLCTSTRRL